MILLFLSHSSSLVMIHVSLLTNELSVLIQCLDHRCVYVWWTNSCLDKGAWRAAAHGVTKSRLRLRDITLSLQQEIKKKPVLWVTLLCTWNSHSIVNQLYSSFVFFLRKGSLFWLIWLIVLTQGHCYRRKEAERLGFYGEIVAELALGLPLQVSYRLRASRT